MPDSTKTGSLRLSRIELAPEVSNDFDRILDHLAQYEVENPASRIREIVEAINVLEHNPLIGRPAKDGKRELVIGRQAHGYLALYRYVAKVDTVFVLAIRSQREAGFVIE
ncbi:type II toxin-antitoxin system RelE/ParE family toxin [Propionivibrio sp.]|uniref:type II toxin-antitoxin system RelE/ParE family toxin n=1 Tax=Propionivibrio sp. TaxID=2212460 RepID=UPI003BEFAC02